MIRALLGTSASGHPAVIDVTVDDGSEGLVEVDESDAAGLEGVQEWSETGGTGDGLL